MITAEKDETGNTKVKTRTLLTLLLYCISGSLLTLVNKLAIVAFPFPNMLLVLQNGATVILLVMSFVHASTVIPPLSMAILKVWIPVVLLFVTMLISSLFALVYVSVPTVIVIRNLSTLSVAVLEYFLLNTAIDYLSVATLFGMLFGAVFYAIHDMTFSIPGYAFLLANVIGTSCYQIYIKKIVNMPDMKDMGPTGMSYYNNLISLPILIILAVVMGELRTLSSYVRSMFLPQMKSICVVLLSCILGFSLSTSAFALNKLISPTSIMVANNVNKFSLIFLSEVLVQSTLDVTASVGAVSVLFFGWLYSQTKERFAKPLLLFATIVLLVLYTTLEFKHAFIPIMNSDLFSSSNAREQNNAPSWTKSVTPATPMRAKVA